MTTALRIASRLLFVLLALFVLAVIASLAWWRGPRHPEREDLGT